MLFSFLSSIGTLGYTIPLHVRRMDQDQPPALKSPSDEEIISSLLVLRQQHPDLGRSKVLIKLKEENGWTLSDLRLKNLMSKHGLGSSISNANEPIAYPQNALAAQQRYKDESTRCFKLYSRGPYDFGVTPNSDQAIRINVSKNHRENRSAEARITAKIH